MIVSSVSTVADAFDDSETIIYYYYPSKIDFNL